MNDILNVEEIFGENVFTVEKLRERLAPDVFTDLMNVMEHGGELSKATADAVAEAMKVWALEHGATHFCHWFQPLNGITAEKHDAFVTHPNKDGRTLLKFSGKELIKGEPDASSFPSGGLRTTFEARGYTAWDITSPVFLKEDATGVILCIPTAFCSYTGEALDKKTPLLRSMEALSQQALRIVRLFGNTEATKVTPSVGAEQEYFLVDKAKYDQREDLIFAGRTLFGAPAPKGQEMEDHYFGAIRERIGAYMKDINVELWKLGVTAKTQHNEAAPAQHELAPIYETANVATDHNQLMMEVMKKVANRHGMACLLHEKPFAGINGSGKHNNWSISTDNGVNMLDPGDSPNENVQFLLVLACILKAVDTHADLLRMSAADVGNDQRLGAAEAPPAIISVFLGEQLEDVVKQLVETGEATSAKKNGTLATGVSTVPDLEIDATDRNRTSPFAFTGNKFEFRSVGSSDSIGLPNTVLNAIVAEAFCEAADRIENADNKELAIHDLIKEYMSEHQRIIFNGDGYSEEWVREAERRGLPNLPSMVDSIDALTTDKSVRLFEKFGIFSKSELDSRAEIEYEIYAKTTNIEARTMLSMTDCQIIPAVSGYMNTVATTIVQMAKADVEPAVQRTLLGALNTQLIALKKGRDDLEAKLRKASQIKDNKEKAFAFHESVVPAMKAVRLPADKLETMVDRRVWPFPVYSDLIFEV